ncbi:MAG TPA: FMN-binding protein [Thermoanaerobaculia bacterium]|nr:FMN-binding protein [Thermoanaerobaculia bacterium]
MPVLLAVALGASAVAPAGARVLLSTEEALNLAFPGCKVERGTVYLTEAQLAAARRLAGVEVRGAVVHPYAARCDGRPGGTAYFDVHRVRTLPETVMVVVAPDGEVTRIEVLSFQEPEDYLPRRGWYQQFEGERLDGDLRLKGDIRGIAGATLTARATTEAVRRVLALHRVLSAPPGGGEARREKRER